MRAPVDSPGEPEARRASSPEESAAQSRDADLKHNFKALFVHGLLGQTGFRLLQTPTFLPSYLSLLAGNNSAVGIARALQSLGMSISPYLGAWRVEQATRAKGLAIFYGSTMRVQILLLALAALLLPATIALPAVWTVIGIWGFASGLQMVTFNFMISKTIPPQLRGRLLGLRNASAGVVLLGVSAAGGWIVDRYGFPDGYGWTFLLSFVLTSVGLGAFASVREPESSEPMESAPFFARLRTIPKLLVDEPNFRRFVVARLLATAGRGALPFYIIHFGQRFDLSGTRLALYTMVYTMAESASALVWGLWSDRVGFRRVFMASLGSWLVGSALVIVALPEWSSYFIFFLVGAGYSGFMLSSQNLVLEFGRENERPMRIAATNATAELVGMVGYLGAGLLADAVPLVQVFAYSIALQVAAIVAMGRVKEPRQHMAPAVPAPSQD